jgi:STE24 endopeptidase
MTATRIVRAATLAAAGGIWFVLAVLLWRTSVPALHLPHLDERAVFGARLVRSGESYDDFLVWNWALATVATLAAYALVVRRARRLVAGMRLASVNAGIILGLLTVTAAWAAGLPFSIVATWWERRHGVSRQGYVGQILGQWQALLATAVAALVLLAVVLLLAQRLGGRWWIAAAPVVVGLAVGLQFAQPYVSSLGTSPVHAERVRAAIAQLERRENAGRPTVRVEDVSRQTRDANAFAVGFGISAHVFLWNTLLQAPFSFRDVRFVLAHELAHVARSHVLRGLAWFALLLVPVLVAIACATDLRRPESVPAALLLVAVAQLALLPARNAISRRIETEADWSALNATRDPAAARGLFRGFARTSLDDPSPAGWLHFLLDDHPTLLQRVELAEAWARLNR